MADDAPQIRAGAGYAVAAYTFWGFAPAYFVWVSYALPLEILAYRIVWSLPLLAILLFLGRQWQDMMALDRAVLIRLGYCSILLTVNWLTFIYAIQIGRIAETSLGYFINPLVSIVLGAVILKERLRRLQWVSVAIAALGVLFELVMQGELPWYGLILAFSFGFYGLLRKQINVPSVAGLSVECAIVAPFALAYLVWAYVEGVTPSREIQQIALLMLGGAVTVVPLVWFAAAAIRLPLTLLGFIQYLAPSISLVLAIVVYAENVTPSRWVSFAMIWLALVIFSLEGVYAHRRLRTTT